MRQAAATLPEQYEKLVAAGLVLLMVVLGWGGHVAAVWSLPYYDRMLLPITLAMAVFALGLVYDAAERRLGAGRGLYAAALFASLPGMGLVATDPARLGTAGLALMVALGVWQAVRAEGDNRPFFLGMLTFLTVIADFFYGAGALPLLFAWLLVIEQDRKQSLWLLGAAITGVILHQLWDPGLFRPNLAVHAAETWPAVVLPWLPWGLAIPCAISQKLQFRGAVPTWWVYGALTGAVMILLAAFGQLSFAAAAATLAPVLALYGADLVYRHFMAAPASARRPAAVRMPLGTAAAMLFVMLAAALGLAHAPLVRPWMVAAGALLAGALVWTVFANVPRWSFALLFAAGMLLGYLMAQREPLNIAPGDLPASASLPFVVGAIAGAGAVWVTVGLVFTRWAATHVRSKEYRFGEANLLSFEGGAGRPATVPETAAYSFVVFGDVTGAESPFATRRGGWLVFRALVKVFEATKPAFAVSLGDLASQATPAGYKRVRKLLAQIPVPLAVTPGNHDLFARNEYDATCFHALYGADNQAFRRGPVKFVILNNAWGSIDEQQFEWLERELAEAAPFKLLFCHKPPFDFRADVFYGMEERPHAERLHELARAHGVTAVFSGHIHTLLAEQRDGITYVISGGGGSKPTSPEDQYHYLAAQVTETELVIRALPLAERSPAEPLLELRFAPRA